MDFNKKIVLIIATIFVLGFSAQDVFAPTTEDAQLTALDAAAGDFFGFPVAISGDTMVVGATGDDDGCPDGDPDCDTGSAYVFTRSGTTWTQQAKLTASDGAAADTFGESVGVSGDTIVVGATGDDDAGFSSGSAYVFEKPDAGWSSPLPLNEDAKLTASVPAAGDRFGKSVGVSGDTIVVGSFGDDDGGPRSGSVYVFEKPDAGWSSPLNEDAKLTASDASAGDRFGWSVAISGDTVVVGATEDDVIGPRSGSAYVFTRSETTWSQQAKLTASDGVAADAFGNSIGFSGDTVVVGSVGDDDGGPRSGSAYVFEKPDAGWSSPLNEDAKLTASDASAGDRFGESVGVSGDTVVVGSFGDDDVFLGSGSAYVFEKPDAGWLSLLPLNEDVKLTASDAAFGDQFGRRVAILGDTLMVGVPFSDDNVAGQDSGSVYVFGTSGDTTPPIITLTGANPQTIAKGAGYTELGATTDDGSPVTIDSSAFNDEVGSYDILYDSVDASDNPADQVTRTVNVVDTTPVITDYEALNILSDGSQDFACTSGVTFSSGSQAIPLLDADTATCTVDKTKEDKLKPTVASTDETDLITFYLNNGDGYSVDTQVTGQATGNDINFKSKATSGILHIKLVEVNPANGAVITVLDTQDETAAVNVKIIISDISSLQGTVSKDNSFGIQLTWEANSASSSQLEIKWGKYGQATKRTLINIGESENGALLTNTPPVAFADTFSVQKDSTDNVLTVLDNDTDAENDPLTVDSIDTTGTVGTVINNGNDVTYTPTPGFTGIDSFAYITTDGEFLSNSATVDVVVAEVIEPPIVTDYETLNILSDGSQDFACTSGVTFSSGGQAVALIDADTATCTADKTKEDKLKPTVASTDETDLITFYLNNGVGYSVDTQVTGQATGNDINFKSKATSGILHIKLVEVNPANGAVITVLDTQDETAAVNVKIIISDISSLQGTVSKDNSFGIQLTWEANSASSSQLEIKWGKYGQATKRTLINIGISQ